MEQALISYGLRVHLVCIILVILYRLMLHGRSQLHTNRVMLLALLVVCFVLPITQQLSWIPRHYISQNFHDQLAGLLQATTNNAGHAGTRNSEESLLNISVGLIGAYSIGCIVLLLRLAGRYINVARIIRRSRRRKIRTGILCYTEEHTGPFSFFRYIVLPQGITRQDRGQIIWHEQAHVRQAHSIDVLLSELACILLWINPCVYLFRKMLRLNLEFLADKSVLSSGANPRDYQLALIRFSISDRHLSALAFELLRSGSGSA